MSNFRDAFRSMEHQIRSDMGVGAQADGTPAWFNGSPVTVTTSPIEATQPMSMGGYQDLPTIRIAVKREDSILYRKATLGQNRFRIGTTDFRAIKIFDDPLSSEVSFDCAAVDN